MAPRGGRARSGSRSLQNPPAGTAHHEADELANTTQQLQTDIPPDSTHEEIPPNQRVESTQDDNEPRPGNSIEVLYFKARLCEAAAKLELAQVNAAAAGHRRMHSDDHYQIWQKYKSLLTRIDGCEDYFLHHGSEFEDDSVTACNKYNPDLVSQSFLARSSRPGFSCSVPRFEERVGLQRVDSAVTKSQSPPNERSGHPSIAPSLRDFISNQRLQASEEKRTILNLRKTFRPTLLT
ncbi:MAG: hypothetical protein L6R36_009077 [Xanthoria steineri]|nr:MAG: hypothetical protein L6R36_009077 [Xanthoria steineri]